MADIKNLSKKNFKYQINPLLQLPLGDEAPTEINMLVEIPKGSINKYEYNTATGLLKLDRVLFEQLPYPIEYGAIPQTWDEDGDPLDIVCLISYPTFPGCLISAKPIGVMKMNDSGEVDDKILAVPVDDIRFKHIRDISDLQKHTLDEIQFFFENYKNLQFKYKAQDDKKVIIERWGDKNEAYEIIEKCSKEFKKKFAKEICNCDHCDDCKKEGECCGNCDCLK